MARADSGEAAIMSWYICMRCIPAHVLKAHKSVHTEWLSHVDMDNGPEDLLWTILLGPDGVGYCRQGWVFFPPVQC